MLTARGDVELLDAVEDEQRGDAVDVPAFTDDVVFTTGDWFNLLKPTGGREGGSAKKWRRWKRASGMVAAISGIAVAVITFSGGDPTVDHSINLETSAGDAPEPEETGTEEDGDTLALSLGDLGREFESLSTDEAAFLGLLGPSEPSTTTTTVAETTTTASTYKPVIEPESEWVDAGNGVAVPDVLLRIRYCESTNDYQAAHAVSSARGAYQFLTSSWEWYGHAARYGAARADLATPAQQDEAAVLTLKRDGTRPWLASRSCWSSSSIPPNYATIKPRPRPTTTSTTSSTSSTDDSGTTSTSTDSSSSTDTTGSTTTTDSSTTSTTAESTTSTDDPTTTSDSSGSTSSGSS